MKFFASVVLAVAAAPWAAADLLDACYIDGSSTLIFEDICVTYTDESEDIEEWYGWQGSSGPGGDNWSANTDSNVEGGNSGNIGIIPVKFKDDSPPSIGISVILDQPKDGSGGTLVTKITCVPDTPADNCGAYPTVGFLDVKDDTGDKFVTVGGALYSGNWWDKCCTDGFATQHLDTCVTVCIEIISKAGAPTELPNNRRNNPSGLDRVVVWSGGDDGDPGTKRTLKDAPPVPGDKFCLKTCGGSTGGDPHFKTFGAKWYDFMGACDLVLLDAPKFTPDAGLRVDIRTAIRYAYSYIESAVLVLGDDIFEVSSFGQYAINGISNAELPATLNGFSITHTQPSEKVHEFQVSFSEHEHVTIKTLKDMVSVKWGMLLGDRFEGARGMLGDANNGQMLSRNGTVTFEDPNEFAAEWQVREDEPMNFMVSRAPQHPAQCVMPEVNTAAQRRLGETATIEAAEEACANWDPEMRAACVHDVIATGDLELAEAGAF